SIKIKERLNMNKKQPNKNVRKTYNDLRNALKEDIYRYNPSDDVLKKRKLKKERREHLLNELERKYDFGETPKKKVVKNAPTKVKIKNKSISDDSKYIEKFRELKKLKEKISKIEEENTVINPVVSNIFTIYHTIETENMDAANMYNVMKALQYQLKKQDSYKKEKKRSNVESSFNNLGGIKEYLKLKNYLTDIGVKTYEIN